MKLGERLLYGSRKNQIQVGEDPGIDFTFFNIFTDFPGNVYNVVLLLD